MSRVWNFTQQREAVEQTGRTCQTHSNAIWGKDGTGQWFAQCLQGNWVRQKLGKFEECIPEEVSQ